MDCLHGFPEIDPLHVFLEGYSFTPSTIFYTKHPSLSFIYSLVHTNSFSFLFFISTLLLPISSRLFLLLSLRNFLPFLPLLPIQSLSFLPSLPYLTRDLPPYYLRLPYSAPPSPFASLSPFLVSCVGPEGSRIWEGLMRTTRGFQPSWDRFPDA